MVDLHFVLTYNYYKSIQINKSYKTAKKHSNQIYYYL